MEIFNVGPLELGLILILALIVLGPDGMVKSARQMGRFVAKIVRSPIWKEMISTTEEIRTLPQKIVKEANLEESMEELSKLNRTPLIMPDPPKPEVLPAEVSQEESPKENSAQSTDQ
jgi:Sec-independent protein translocase protein TatA